MTVIILRYSKPLRPKLVSPFNNPATCPSVYLTNLKTYRHQKKITYATTLRSRLLSIAAAFINGCKLIRRGIITDIPSRPKMSFINNNVG